MTLASINPAPPVTPSSVRISLDGSFAITFDHRDFPHEAIVRACHTTVDNLLAHAEHCGGSVLIEIVPAPPS